MSGKNLMGPWMEDMSWKCYEGKDGLIIEGPYGTYDMSEVDGVMDLVDRLNLLFPPVATKQAEE